MQIVRLHPFVCTQRRLLTISEVISSDSYIKIFSPSFKMPNVTSLVCLWYDPFLPRFALHDCSLALTTTLCTSMGVLDSITSTLYYYIV